MRRTVRRLLCLLLAVLLAAALAGCTETAGTAEGGDGEPPSSGSAEKPSGGAGGSGSESESQSSSSSGDQGYAQPTENAPSEPPEEAGEPSSDLSPEDYEPGALPDAEKPVWEDDDGEMISPEELEEAANSAATSNAWESDRSYYVKVNVQMNTVTVYEKDAGGAYTIPLKAMICSTGEDTPEAGVYDISEGKRWDWLALYGNVYGCWVTQIDEHILFHSVPYLTQYDHSSLEYWEYDKLGTSCSMGCVRLQMKDALWIYENQAEIAAVEFYRSTVAGPLGKPELEPVSGNETCRGWDPTDPEEGNPWREG